MAPRTSWLRTGAVAALALAGGCQGPGEPDSEPPRVVESTYRETGDLRAIRSHGQLRLLVVRRPGSVDRLPRAGLPVSSQIRAAARFARSIGLEPVIVLVDHYEELVPALVEGRGDLIVANLPITPALRERLAFTVALDRTRQMLVARADDPIAAPDELAGRSITVGFNSRFWDTAQALQQAHPGLRVESLPGLSTARKLDMVADGHIDLTIVDGNTLERVLQYREEVRGAFPVSDETGVGWGLRRDARRLKASLDRFITRRKLTQFDRERRTGDLPAIERSRTLRVVTRNSAVNYFVWRGQLMGFEYELARRFAEDLGVRLEVVVAEDHDDLLPMLRAGDADIAAAFLTPAGRTSADGIAWSRPYHFAVQQVVSDRAEDAVARLADLEGRTFHVRESSRYWRTLQRLRHGHELDIEVRAVPGHEEPETTIEKVARGDYDLTLADDHIVKNAAIWNERVHAVLDIGEPVAHRWALRAGNPRLLAAANEFLDRAYRGTFYNVIYAKYFTDRDRIRRYQAQRIDLGDAGGRRLTPYDDLIQEYAARHELDWRLIAAQIFHESSFDPDARSWSGAVGLMQILPRTARQVGVTGDLTHPETNIRAGVRYLDWLRARFEEELSVQDRTWFTLAAFNAGAGHVRDARRLAARLGLDPDRWFDNVETAMLRLSQRQHFRHARFGYVRGWEPVEYVRRIRERYQAYVLWTQDCWPDCPPGEDTAAPDPGRTLGAPVTEAP